MANNNFDPNIMAQLMQMYKEGKIPNMNPNMGMGTMNPMGNMNPNMGMGNMNTNIGMNSPNPFWNPNPMMWNNQGFNFNTQNVNQAQNNNNGENWIIYFERKYDNNKIVIQINSDETVNAAFSKYRIKSLESDVPLKFSFNNKPLDGNLSLSASGLSNNSTITVEKIDLKAQPKIPQAPPGFWTLIFERKDENKFISVQVESSKKVKDAINAFKSKLGHEEEMIFVFNSKTLNPEMTLTAAGLRDNSKILVISLSSLEGA